MTNKVGRCRVMSLVKTSRDRDMARFLQRDQKMWFPDSIWSVWRSRVQGSCEVTETAFDTELHLELATGGSGKSVREDSLTEWWWGKSLLRLIHHSHIRLPTWIHCSQISSGTEPWVLLEMKCKLFNPELIWDRSGSSCTWHIFGIKTTLGRESRLILDIYLLLIHDTRRTAQWDVNGRQIMGMI